MLRKCNSREDWKDGGSEPLDLGEEVERKGGASTKSQSNSVPSRAAFMERQGGPGSWGDERGGVEQQQGVEEVGSTEEVVGSVSYGTWVFALSTMRNYWRVSSRDVIRLRLQRAPLAAVENKLQKSKGGSTENVFKARDTGGWDWGGGSGGGEKYLS